MAASGTRRIASFVIGLVLVAAGLAFAVLPKDWIEGVIGFEPDGGSGAVELAIVLVPVVLGAIVLWRAAVRSSAQPTPSPRQGA